MRQRIDGRIEAVDLALKRAAGQGVDGDIHLVALLDEGVFALGDAHEELHRRHLLDREERGRHREHVADVEVAGGDIAGQRAAEDGVLLEILVVGLAELVAELGGLEVGLGDAALFVEALQTGVLDLVILDLQGQLVELEAVHFGEHLALADIVADLDVDLADTAALLGHDVVGRIGLDRARIGADLRHARIADGQGLDEGRLLLRGSILGFGRIAPAAGRDGQREGK